ncbi:MAG: hypothetical protein GC153_12360 [Alphaproteobacteria bacterium]|nr:hypothetical protein [Alphaproteobacteria bacterium]
MIIGRSIITVLGAAGVALILEAAAQAQTTYRNGVGADPDGDTNPATNTGLTVSIGDAAEAAFDPPFRVITFEAPPGGNGDVIKSQYEARYGVTFSAGLKRQICEGRRYFRYDSQCTYLRAPSGKYAALYRNDWGYPLQIRFTKPVCVAALAIYPTGGAEGQRYRITLQPYAADGSKLKRLSFYLTWTENTFRWRAMAEARFSVRASRLDVNVTSLHNKYGSVRFLIDDLATISGDDCGPSPVDVAAGAASRSAAPKPEPVSGS